MLEHTKKRHTDVTLSFIGPSEMKAKVVDFMRSMGFMDTESSIPWRQAFPEFAGNEKGVALAGARGKEELTQKQLSEKTGIPQRHISEMENGKRVIGKKNAKLFSIALKIDYRIFL